MTPSDPRADRMRDALDLLVHNGEDEIGRIRARVTALVASVAADAQSLVERSKHEGADAVESAFIQMHVRELAAAQADLADRRERLRELKSVVDFVERPAGDNGKRS